MSRIIKESGVKTLRCSHSVIKERQECTAQPPASSSSSDPTAEQDLQSRGAASSLALGSFSSAFLCLSCSKRYFLPVEQLWYQKTAYTCTCENSSHCHAITKSPKQQGKITVQGWLQADSFNVKLFMTWHENKYWWYICQTLTNHFQPSLNTGKQGNLPAILKSQGLKLYFH